MALQDVQSKREREGREKGGEKIGRKRDGRGMGERRESKKTNKQKNLRLSALKKKRWKRVSQPSFLSCEFQ